MRDLAFITPIVVLAAVFRLQGIADQALWWSNGADEVYAVRASMDSLQNLIFPLRDNGNMLAFYLIGHLWLTLLPSIPPVSEVLLRVLPVTFSVATIPVVYLLTRQVASQIDLDRRFNALAAICASLFFAVHPLTIRYAQEFRAYSLQMLAVAIATLSLVLIATKTSNLRHKQLALVSWVTACSISIYSHMISVLFLASQCSLTLFWTFRVVGDKKLARWLVGAGIVAAILLIPLALTVLTVGASQIEWVEELTVKRGVALVGSLIGVSRFDIGWSLYALLVLAGTVPIALVTYRTYKALPESWFVLTGLIAPTACAIVFGIATSLWVTSIWMERYFGFLLIPFSVLTGVGLSAGAYWLMSQASKRQLIRAPMTVMLLATASAIYVANSIGTLSRAGTNKFSDALVFRDVVSKVNGECHDAAVRLYHSSNEANLRSLVKWYGLNPSYRFPIIGDKTQILSDYALTGGANFVCLLLINSNEVNAVIEGVSAAFNLEGSDWIQEFSYGREGDLALYRALVKDQ